MKLDLDRLPASARLYAELIGLEATISLVKAYGGRRLWPHRDGPMFTELAGHIGEQAAGILAAHFREWIAIPTCDLALRAVLRDGVRAEFDRLTHDEGLSARKAVAALAGQPPHRYTERYIWTILSSVETGRLEEVEAGRNTNQMDLF